MQKQVLIFIFAATLLTGCNTADQFFATPVIDPVTGKTNSWVINQNTQGAVNAVGSAIPPWGWILTVTYGLLASGWTIYLNKKYNQSNAGLVATVEAVGEFRDGLKASGPVGTALDDMLVDKLKLAHVEAGVSSMMKTVVDENVVPATARTKEEVSKVLVAAKPIV